MALQSGGEGLIGKSGPNDGHEDFMQVGEALDGIGEGLLVHAWILGLEAFFDHFVVDRGKCELVHALPLN